MSVPRATTRAHTGMYCVTYTESSAHMYVHSDDDTYNAAADTFLSRPCPSTSTAPHIPLCHSLDSTPKDSLTLRHRVWRGGCGAAEGHGYGRAGNETGAGGERELKGGSRSVSRGSREKLGFISRARGTVARGLKGESKGRRGWRGGGYSAAG